MTLTLLLNQELALTAPKIITADMALVASAAALGFTGDSGPADPYWITEARVRDNALDDLAKLTAWHADPDHTPDFVYQTNTVTDRTIELLDACVPMQDTPPSDAVTDNVPATPPDPVPMPPPGPQSDDAPDDAPPTD